MEFIGFNRPYLSGREQQCIQDAVTTGPISGGGRYTTRCEQFFQDTYGFRRSLMTSSCTHALEMSALLLGIGPGDEVILPSYTYVSTANAFALRGATLRFADSSVDHPNIDPDAVADLVTPKTRAIVVVHYAGNGCAMNRLGEISRANKIFLVEDAAHSINASYNGKMLGSFGALSAFSFHETKNITGGTGGLLVVNDPGFEEQAEVIRNKGTNRAAFDRGEINQYSWVGLGSSYAPSEISSAFLFPQLADINAIERKRTALWNQYAELLKPAVSLGISLPAIPEGAVNNGHIFYIVCANKAMRDQLISFLRDRNIQAVFHYQSLHSSPYFKTKHDGRSLPNSDKFSDCLLRLPMHYSLTPDDVQRVCENVIAGLQ